MRQTLVVLLALVWLVTPGVSAENDAGPLRRRALEGANRAVRLIDRTSATFLDKRKCFTCHTQTFAALVLTDAARAGIDFDKNNFSVNCYFIIINCYA